MSIRHLNVLRVLLCAYAGFWPAAHAVAAETAAPQRPLEFATVITPTGGEASPVECVVDFGPALPISAMAFSPDGKLLAVGGYQEVLLWDLEAAKLAKRIAAGKLGDMVRPLVFIEDGKALAIGDGPANQAGAVKIFSVATGKQTATLDGPKKAVCSLALSPDGKTLAAGDAEGRVCVWDLGSRKLAKSINAHKNCVAGVAFSPDGKRLATAGADEMFQVWDIEKWESLIRYTCSGPVHSVAFSNDGKSVLAAVGGPEERGLRVGRIETDLEASARRTPKAQTLSTGAAMPLALSWPVKGTYVFVSFDDGSVKAYKGAASSPAATCSGHSDWVYCVAATPDGSKLASGGADGTVKLWNLSSSKPLATLVQLAPRSDDWFIVTPEGQFATSSAALVRWKTTGSSASPQELTDRYCNPEAIAKSLAEPHPFVDATQRKKAASRSTSSVKKYPKKSK